MPYSKLTVLMKFSALVTFGLTLGGVLVASYEQVQSSPRRSLASVAPYKPQGRVLGKQAAAMTVEIVGPASYPENSSEVVELVGYLTQHLSADTGLTYTWSLPEGVELVRGPLSDTFTELKLGRPHAISVLVRGFSSERQKLISLKTELTSGHTPLTASAIVVSRPEDTPETKVMDLQAQARAAAATAEVEEPVEKEDDSN